MNEISVLDAALESGSQHSQKTSWDKPEPCYLQITDTGLIALSLKPLSNEKASKVRLQNQLVQLHRRHLRLDQIVRTRKVRLDFLPLGPLKGRFRHGNFRGASTATLWQYVALTNTQQPTRSKALPKS